MHYLALLMAGLCCVWSYPLNQFSIYADDIFDDPDDALELEALYDLGR